MFQNMQNSTDYIINACASCEVTFVLFRLDSSVFFSFLFLLQYNLNCLGCFPVIKDVLVSPLMLCLIDPFYCYAYVL